MARKQAKIKPDPKIPKKILVLRYSSLGDVALTNPLLERLKQEWPNVPVYFATKRQYAPVLQHNSALDGIFLLEGKGFWDLWNHIGQLRKLDPTLVLDLHDSLRTHLVSTFLGKARILVYDKEKYKRRLMVGKITQNPGPHTIQKYLKALEPLGILSPLRVPFDIHISRANQRFLREYSKQHKISSSRVVVGLSPGARWFTKRWPALNYAELASRLVEDYRCQLLWFGSREEIP